MVLFLGDSSAEAEGSLTVAVMLTRSCVSRKPVRLSVRYDYCGSVSTIGFG
jgi:hypothetical protein